ncbi:MAG: GFA family protein [Granulosicoccus sp.]
MSTDRQAGGCQCGSVRYSTSRQVVRAMACHCTTCKLRTGSAYGVGVYFQDEDVSITQGQLNTFEFRSNTSGRWLRNEFCPKCGTTVTWTTEMRPGLRGIAGGSYDDPDWYRIEAHIWAHSARSDMCYPEDMAVYPQALKQ